jgi:signal transduction histidine kinase
VKNIVPQEFRLFRVCLGITFLAALVFLFIHHHFIAPAAQGVMTWIFIWSLAYSLALYRFIDLSRLRAGAVLLILIHWATDTFALFWEPVPVRALSFLQVYSFIMLFNIMVVSWPEVAFLDGLLWLSAAVYIFLPASGFAASVAGYGVNPLLAAALFLIFFGLLLVLGTALVEIKRRTESRLHYLNENLNRLVQEQVAETEKSNREARQYQEQVEKILRYSPVGVVITDERLNLLYSNGVHFRPEGEPRGEGVYGKPLPLTVLKDIILEARTKADARGEDNLLGQRLEFADADGAHRLLHYSFLRVKLWGETGEVTRQVLITEDITREENLRRKLIHSDQLASMGKMAANLAHELHNPMSVIKIYIDFLERGGLPEDKRSEAITTIKNNILRINRLIKSILTFARQENPKKEWIDVVRGLKNTIELTTHFKHFVNLRIHVDCDQDFPLLLADEHRLSQVFINLLNNARDAVGEGEGDLYVTCRRAGDEVLLSFRDTGKGIKETDLPHIFTPFFTTKPPGQGTGLGLSISYGIIQEHGGNIDVESHEGAGSTFTIRLPISAPQPQPKSTGDTEA